MSKPVTVCFIDNLQHGVHSGKMDTIQGLVRKYGEAHGIAIVDRMAQAHVVLCMRYTYEIACSGKPVILCERYDASTIGHTRHDLTRAKVLRVFKEFVLRTQTAYENTSICKGRLHYARLQEHFKLPGVEISTSVVEASSVAKIVCVPWNLSQYSHLDAVGSMKRARELYRADHARKWDVVCITQLHDNDEILNAHRTLLRKTVAELGSTYSVFTGTVAPNEFEEYLANATVCVCPFGIGERIATDQKALLAGCIVLKPDCRYMHTFPDIYNDNCMVFFDVDASGASLKSQLRMVLANVAKFRERTTHARAMLLGCDEQAFVAHFAAATRAPFL